jgi:hypothetical protein
LTDGPFGSRVFELQLVDAVLWYLFELCCCFSTGRADEMVFINKLCFGFFCFLGLFNLDKVKMDQKLFFRYDFFAEQEM